MYIYVYVYVCICMRICRVIYDSVIMNKTLLSPNLGDYSLRWFHYQQHLAQHRGKRMTKWGLTSFGPMGSPEITSDGNCACNRKFNHVLLLFLLKGVDIFHPRMMMMMMTTMTMTMTMAIRVTCKQSIYSSPILWEDHPAVKAPQVHWFFMSFAHFDRPPSCIPILYSPFLYH